MNTSILSNTCIVFLLATASAFGIGPGDNARPFMASHASYIATVIDRSTPQELLVAGSNVTTGAVTRIY